MRYKDDTTKIGAVAEFFIHLFLRELGYKQEFLFYNLEERSIKKGFDGYFSQGETQFIVESKSGFESTRNISHKAKIKEAYNDGADYFIIGNGLDTVLDFKVGTDKLVLNKRFANTPLVDLKLVDTNRGLKIVLSKNNKVLLKGISKNEVSVFQLF